MIAALTGKPAEAERCCTYSRTGRLLFGGSVGLGESSAAGDAGGALGWLAMNRILLAVGNSLWMTVA
jgi:hypothetical protein